MLFLFFYHFTSLCTSCSHQEHYFRRHLVNCGRSSRTTVHDRQHNLHRQHRKNVSCKGLAVEVPCHLHSNQAGISFSKYDLLITWPECHRVWYFGMVPHTAFPCQKCFMLSRPDKHNSSFMQRVHTQRCSMGTLSYSIRLDQFQRSIASSIRLTFQNLD